MSHFTTDQEIKVGDRVREPFEKNEGKVICIEEGQRDPLATVVWDHSPKHRDFWYVADLRKV